MMKFKNVTLFFCVLWFISASVFASELYETQWTTLLKKSVKQSNRKQVTSTLVDYALIKDSQSFSSLLRGLNGFDESDFQTDKAKEAFWINVYNIAVVKLVIEHYPTASIHSPDNDVLWKRPVIMIGGKMLTLQDIQFDKLGAYKDYRLFFALSNATLSGPDLLDEAYSEEKLDAQLDSQFKRFILNSTKGVAVYKDTREVKFSLLLKNIEDQCEDKGGLKGLVQPYLTTPLSDCHVGYMYFNWNLNNK